MDEEERIRAGQSLEHCYILGIAYTALADPYDFFSYKAFNGLFEVDSPKEYPCLVTLSWFDGTLVNPSKWLLSFSYHKDVVQAIQTLSEML